MEDKKGIGTVMTIFAITSLMLSLIGINITLTLVNSLTETTAVGDDSDSLEKLGAEIREKCGAISGQNNPETDSYEIDLEVTYADEVVKDGESLEMHFPEDDSRDVSLPDSDNCGVDFVSGSGGKLEKGAYTLEIGSDTGPDPPVVTVSVLSTSSSTSGNNGGSSN